MTGRQARADWIYVFDIEDRPGPDGSPAPVNLRLVIGTDAVTLSPGGLRHRLVLRQLPGGVAHFTGRLA